MPNVNLMGPTDWTAQQEDILRRRRMAELMQQQAVEPIQNPNSQGPLGSVPTPISWTQGLAKMLQAYTGARQQADLSGAQRELGQRYTSEGQKALIEGLKTYRGTPGTPDITGGQPGTPDEIYQPGQPATQASPDQAIGILGGHPMTQPLAQAILTQQMKAQEPYSLAAGAKRYGPGGAVIADNPKPVLPKEHVIGGKVYQSGPGGVNAIGGPGEGAWSEPYQLGGAMVQRNDLTGQVRQAVTRPPQVNVNTNMPPQEKAFESKLGTEQADALIKGRQAADDAAQIINTVNVGRNILKSGMVTGFGANAIVSVGQALKQAGVDFGGDATANAQAYTAAMAGNVGKIIKQFGSGTGLSDADREYATKMAGGLITLDKAAIEKILDINEKAARNVIRLHNRRSEGIKSNIPLQVEEPNNSSPASVEKSVSKSGKPMHKENGQWVYD